MRNLWFARQMCEALRGKLAGKVTPAMLDLVALERSEIAHAGPQPSSIAAAKYTGMRLSELTKLYLDRHHEQWRPNTRSTNRDRCELLVELAQDPALADIDRPLIWRVVDQLKLMPAGRQIVRAKYSEKATFHELISLAQEHSLPRLTPTALKKVIGGFSGLFAWAVYEKYLTENPASKLAGDAFKSTGGREARARDAREAFTSEELSRIFAAEWFQSGTGTRTKKGRFFEFRPYYYWLPLLGIFTGARINELSQLYLADIRSTEEGVAFLDFNLVAPGKMDIDEADEASNPVDKSLKSTNSERQVPIHSRLLELGFLDYVDALHKAEHQRLLPELKHDAVKGYGKAAGRWFNERYLGQKVKMVRNGKKTFHSLRHQGALKTLATAALIPSWLSLMTSWGRQDFCV